MTPCLTTDNIGPHWANDMKDKRNNCEENFTESFEKEVSFCLVCK